MTPFSQLKMQLLRLAYFLSAHHFFRSLHWLFSICIPKPSSSKLYHSSPLMFHPASAPLGAAPHSLKLSTQKKQVWPDISPTSTDLCHKSLLMKLPLISSLLKPNNSSKGNLTLEHTGRKLKEWYRDT